MICCEVLLRNIIPGVPDSLLFQPASDHYIIKVEIFIGENKNKNYNLHITDYNYKIFYNF